MSAATKYLKRFPSCEIISNERHMIKFVLSDTDTSVANTLRRIMISEVPTLAIDMVEFKDNTTCLQDEYIAHRLGMIPLRWEKDNGKYGDVSEEFNNSNFCQACTDGCPKCLVEFELSVNFDERAKQGGDDANFKTSTLIVTSEDLLSSNDMVSAGSFISDDEQENLHDGGITIVKMGPGQVIKLVATARMGISKEHAKWSPVSVATYRFWPETHLNEAALATLTMEQKQELVDCCPDKILEINQLSSDIQFVKDFEYLCTYTEDLYNLQNEFKKKKEDEDFITVKQGTNRFIFEVESSGCMHADEIVMSALKVLSQKLAELQVANTEIQKASEANAGN